MNKLRQFDPKTFDEALYRKLSRNVHVADDFRNASLVNFLDASRFPVHKWFFVREGFSPKLVYNTVDKLKLTAENTVLDPFCGSGTTLLAAKEMGISSIGFDVNPLMTFIAKVKLHSYTRDELEEMKALVARMGACSFKSTLPTPDIPNIRNLFYDDKEDVLGKLLMYKEFILGVESQVAKDFLMLGWLSILEKVSNTRKGGLGLKMEKRFNKNPKKTLFERYALMLDDLEVMVRRTQTSAKTRLYEESILTSSHKIKGGSVDAAITSPPYPNCFNYLEIYRIELWIGDFVKSRKDLDKINAKSVRSHLSIPLKKGSKCRNRELMDSLGQILARIPKAHLWDKRIPNMLQGYFDDMSEVLEILHAKIRSAGSCVLVSGNLSYGGAIIPVDLMLSQLALDAGFKEVEVNVARLLTPELNLKRRNTGGNYLRESLIMMKKG